MKKIVLTGGGTAGHVTPNIALLPQLKKEGFEIHYIGSNKGIEKQLIEAYDIPYYGISSGKLRRYFDVKNFTDPFKVIKGYTEAKKIIKNIQPSIVFSKGGFVTVPVILAAHRRSIPIIVHESDMTPGLANKISLPFVNKICATFPETLFHVPNEKGVLTGTPIREELFLGNREKGLSFCKFDNSLPVIMIIGGSLGSVKINKAIRTILPTLIKRFQIVHICGKGNLDNSLENMSNYCQFEYIKKELPNLFAMADIVISRAGANTISELLALKKPNILIPLSAAASRGDQILNAKSFEKQGYSYVIEEENLNNTSLLQAINKIANKKEEYIFYMNQSKIKNGVDNIISLINKTLKNDN